ncbi:MAG: hypothetical protein HYY90_02850, partial [Candidatus Omnitrophica bacterium]|nr:hypothetical protein [Candidatus Omnitrophota bacterium]MBI3083287.1 hypothetical protein [Candidatus Omnitrophota bacterium]
MREPVKGWLVMGLLLGTTAYAIAEEITLTTYYPSPRGVYRELKMNGTGTIEFGAGLTKEPNAGKIGYQTFTADALDIVGAGTGQANRKIKFWNEGGASFEGSVGIGMASPGKALHIRGGQAADGTSRAGITLENELGNKFFLNTWYDQN